MTSIARARPTRPAPESSTRIRRAPSPVLRPLPLGSPNMARLLGGHRPGRSRHGAPGLRSPAHAVRRARLARDVLHDRDGALADERDGHRMGAHAVARDAAGGVGGVDEDRLIKLSPKIELRCRRAYEVFGTLGCLDCGTEFTRPHNRHMRAEKTAQELICSPIG